MQKQQCNVRRILPLRGRSQNYSLTTAIQNISTSYFEIVNEKDLEITKIFDDH